MNAREWKFDSGSITNLQSDGTVMFGVIKYHLEWRGDEAAELITSDNSTTKDYTAIIVIKLDIVLSNKDDRDILFHCLIDCLPWMRA